MNLKQQKLIPAPIARKLLAVSASQWRQLIAERVVDVDVERTSRGAEVTTNIASIERAHKRSLPRD